MILSCWSAISSERQLLSLYAHTVRETELFCHFIGLERLNTYTYNNGELMTAYSGRV